MNQQQPWYYSWPVIIVAFLLFWPLGIALIVMKSMGTRQSMFTGASDKKLYCVIGIVLIVLGILSFRKSFLMALFMILGGIALFYYAEKIARRAERSRLYIDMIVNKSENSLDRIAGSCNVQYDLAVKEIGQLISLGILKGRSIDNNSRVLIGSSPVHTPVAPPIQQKNTPVEMIPVVCPGCGAKVTLPKGATINCEYCDAPIVAK